MRTRSWIGMGLSLVLSLAMAAPAAAASPAVTGHLLVRAAPLAGANGLTFDAQNHLWVGSASGRITEMDPNTGHILAKWGVADGVNGADDLTVGPDGNIYYTAIMTGEVGRLTPAGVHTSVVNLGPGVNPITFSDDGRLFVGQAFMADTLYEVDPAGVKAPRLIRSGLGLNAFDWADGYLWAPQMYAGTVIKLDVDSGAYSVVASGFVGPGSVKVGPDGALYVGDAGGSVIYRVDRSTGTKTVLATGFSPDNLAFDARGRLFASNNERGTVVQVMPGGHLRAISPGGLSGPAGLAVLGGAGHETVYAADVFAFDGFDGITGRQRSSATIGGLLGSAGLFNPFTAGVAGTHLVATSWMTNSVQVYDPATDTVLATYSDFAAPLNAIGVGDDLAVAELGTGHVVLRDAGTGTRSTLASLAVPTGLATSNGALWVADWALGSVFQVMAGGAPIAPVMVAMGLAQPEGLAVASDGSLLVVETGAHRVSRIDLASGDVEPLIEDLEVGVAGPPGVPPTWMFDGIAVGPSGAIYLSAHGIHRYVLHG